MEKMDKGLSTHCTKMGTDSLAENTPLMPQNLFAQFVCPSPKVLDFNEKRLHWAFIVRALQYIASNRHKVEN